MIDIIFAIIIVIAIIKGYRKGLVIGVFSVIGFIVGLAAALKLSAAIAGYLQNNSNVSGRWLPVLSFAIIFLVVALLVNLGARLIEKSLDMAMLGWLNRIGGIILYLLLYIIIFSVLLYYAEKIHLLNTAAIMQSKTYPYIRPWAPKVMDEFGKLLPVFKGMFTQLEDYFTSLSGKIPH